jgi:hypothetical protein
MTSIARISAHVRSVIDDDGAVVLDLKHGRYFSLNGVGAEVWRQLEAGATIANIEAGLRRDYDTEADGLRRDLAAFLERLTRAELIDAGD